jgi:GEVED domain-containing protein
MKKGEHVELAFAAYGTAAPVFDWGDAPDSYGTLSASSGASHGPDWGYWYLGYCNDADMDGSPGVSADGDDGTVTSPVIPIPTACQTAGDDEDGVTFLTPLVSGQSATIEVAVGLSAPNDSCYVTAYIDYNSDGDFNDLGEQVISTLLVPGVHQLTVPVPEGAVAGTTYARFRCAGLPLDESPPTGNMLNGEVEDYMIQISPENHVFPWPTFVPAITGQSSSGK